MSLNKAINSVVALIEGRTDIAKEIFRDPTSDVSNIPDVMARLDAAVEKAAAKAIRNGLIRALAIRPDVKISPNVLSPERAFYDGVNAMEKLFGDIAFTLERHASDDQY
jgi:predicted dinucleotide-utilizing enzyme